MRFEEANKIIEDNKKYRIHFENCDGRFLRSDYIPEDDERPFDTKQKAIKFAISLAKATEGKTDNFYIVDAETYKPVGGWRLSGKTITEIKD